MSKVAQHRKPVKKPAKPEKRSWFSSHRELLLGLALIVVLAGIPFALGKYFEFSTPCPFDGGAYVYSAAHILSGAEIGVEEKPSAQLGTLLVNMVGVAIWGYNDIGPKIVQMLLQMGALILMFIALHRLYGMLAAGLGVIVASIYLSSPLIAKFGNVKEQFMIAFMIMGVSCYILYELRGRWWYALLAGALLSWAPLFKQTGISAIGGVGLFVLLQPVFRHKSWRQMGRDVRLLFAGAAVGTAPLYIWMIGWDIDMALPYEWVWNELVKFLPIGGGGPAKPAADYIGEGRKLVPFSKQWPTVLRFYRLLILPIALAVGAIAARIVVMIRHRRAAKKTEPTLQSRIVLLLAVWWVLDMAFIWISPNSYEQYYLPLNGSAAMLSGYLAYLYSDKLLVAANKSRWVVLGLLSLIVMLIFSWHIFFGVAVSPYSGMAYGQPRNGYSQRYDEIRVRHERNYKAPWEMVGQYIRTHSQPTDTMYVWGWYPGIYVQAERFSSSSLAFTMPRKPPAVVAEATEKLLTEFRARMPLFIVDSRKRHIPVERPPYELWPIMPKGFMGTEKPQFLPDNEKVIDAYDKAWAEMLRREFDEDEAARYEALKPFREFIRKNYRIVSMFGEHVLFELKNAPVGKEPS